MPDYKNENYYFDYDKGSDFAGMVIYGLLKDVLPKEEKIRLYKSISKIAEIVSQDPDDVVAVYGEEYRERANNSYNNSNDGTHKIERNLNVRLGSTFDVVYDSEWNTEFEQYRKDMAELHDIMIKNADKIKFPSDREREYYDTITVMVGDMANGGWRNRVEEDPMYEYAYNMQVKMSLTAAKPEIKDKVFTPGIVAQNNMKTLSAFADVGIIDAISGAMRTSKKVEEHITTGSVTRREVMAEYLQQIERMKKATALSQDEYNMLKEAGATQNDYDEYTSGPRGYAWMVRNLQARVDLINAGWPVEDLSAVGKFFDIMGQVEMKTAQLRKAYNKEKKAFDAEKAEFDAMKEDTAEEKEAKKNKKAEIAKKEDALREKETEYDKYKNQYENLKEDWDRAVKGPLTEMERYSCLCNLQIRMEVVADKLTGVGSPKYVGDRLNERVRHKLTAAEKALMAVGSIGNSLYDSLNEVDPTLVSSSKQFSDLKKAIKALAKAEKELDKHPDDPDKKADYEENVREAAKLATNYLKYKRYQAEGPEGSSHKRSELEAKRVKTVDSVLNTLKGLVSPGSDNTIVDEQDPEYDVYRLVEGRHLKEYVTPEPKNEYEKYMKRYTGSGVINGTREDMLDCLSKAIGCYVWKQQRPKVAFDEEKIRKASEEARSQLNLDGMKDEELRQAVVSSTDVVNAINSQRQKEFGIADFNGYKSYVSDMRLLYQNMPEPTEKSKASYKRLFENIKKAAHLPMAREKYDQDKLFKKAAVLNQSICISACERLKATGKNFTEDCGFSAIALNTIMKHNIRGENYVLEAYRAVNRARGVSEPRPGVFDITTSKYVDFDNYTTNTLKRKIRKYQDGNNLRELDGELLKSTEAGVTGKTLNDYVIKELRGKVARQGEEIKAEEAGKQKAKHQPEGKKKAPQSRPRRNSIG